MASPGDVVLVPFPFRDRPDDYLKNVATIQWPLGSSGEPFPIYSEISPGVVFKGAATSAKEFVAGGNLVAEVRTETTPAPAINAVRLVIRALNPASPAAVRTLAHRPVPTAE